MPSRRDGAIATTSPAISSLEGKRAEAARGGASRRRISKALVTWSVFRDWLGDDAAAISADHRWRSAQEASAHASIDHPGAKSLADRWPELKPHQAKAYLNALLRRVIVESARVVIEIDGERALATLLAGPEASSAIKRSRQERSSASQTS